MEISHFTEIRVGSNFPACFDIKPISDHEKYGVYATIYQDKTIDKKRIELRRKNNHIALFNFYYNDLPLPEYWQDSELIWSTE